MKAPASRTTPGRPSGFRRRALGFTPLTRSRGVTLRAMRDPAALRAFAHRDWALASQSKDLYWRDWKHAHGAAAGILLGDELRRHALAVRPGGPSERERAEDCAAHMWVIEALARVAPRNR
jgi:hypothetical protein